jgi:transcriptional regulator with XRE-family HTH domain
VLLTQPTQHAEELPSLVGEARQLLQTASLTQLAHGLVEEIAGMLPVIRHDTVSRARRCMVHRRPNLRSAVEGSPPLPTGFFQAYGGSGMNESAKRQLADMLRQRRKEARLTQAALARRMGYVREYVTLAEAGRELPSAEFVARSGQVLGSAEELLRLYRQAVAERQADRHPKDAEDDELRRRQFLARMAGLAATASHLPPSDLFNAEPWERLARALEQPASLDTTVLVTLETSIVGYRRQYATVPSGQLLAPVISRLHAVSQLLERVYPDGLRAQLYSLCRLGGRTRRLAVIRSPRPRGGRQVLRGRTRCREAVA